MNTAPLPGKDRLSDAGEDPIPRVSETFPVPLLHGLHARPCALIVKVLHPFMADAKVEMQGAVASGHSILGLMSLAAGPGSKVTFTFTGKDAVPALAAVRKLFAGFSPRSTFGPPEDD